MQTYINEDASYFNGVDLDNATTIQHPLIKQIQANAKLIKTGQLLDDDILDWLSKQDNGTKSQLSRK